MSFFLTYDFLLRWIFGKNTYLRYYFSIFDGYSSYGDVIIDATATAILYLVLCVFNRYINYLK